MNRAKRHPKARGRFHCTQGRRNSRLGTSTLRSGAEFATSDLRHFGWHGWLVPIATGTGFAESILPG